MCYRLNARSSAIEYATTHFGQPVVVQRYIACGKAKPKNSQFIIFPRSDKEEIERTQERVHPSSSLWFYTDKHAAIKKGH